MNSYIKNLNTILNASKNGNKICICLYSKISMFIFGFLVEKFILKNYYIIVINKKFYIICYIKKLLYCKIISKSSCLKYIKYSKISQNLINIGFILVSTNLGLISIFECKKLKIGGKLLFSLL